MDLRERLKEHEGLGCNCKWSDEFERMAKALLRVLELHSENNVGGCSHCREWLDGEPCGADYPCETVRAISETMEDK